MAKNKFETSVCAFVRSVDPSIALLRAHKDRTDDGVPVTVHVEGFLGQTSPFKAAKGKDGAPGVSLPGSHHVCRMPDDRGVLSISARARFISASTVPAMCDNSDFAKAVAALFDKAEEADEGENSALGMVAGRYLWNILNGRFAWRNRFSTSFQSVTLVVKAGKSVFKLVSDPLFYDLNIPLDTIQKLSGGVIEASENGIEMSAEDGIIKVRNAIAGAFIVDGAPVTAEFVWMGEVGRGATVYPSQAYVENDKSGISKLLLTIGGEDPTRKPGRAIMSDQKIGAALRYFDDWHGQGPVVPVNPYAGDKGSQSIYRVKGKKPQKVQNPTLYDLILDEDFMEGNIRYDGKDLPRDIGVRNLAFVISCFIRGGLYQTKGSAETAGGADVSEEMEVEDE